MTDQDLDRVGGQIPEHIQYGLLQNIRIRPRCLRCREFCVTVETQRIAGIATGTL